MVKTEDIKVRSEPIPEAAVFKHHETVLCRFGGAGPAGVVKLRAVFAGLAELECITRQNNRIERNLKASKISRDKNIDTFDLKRVPARVAHQVRSLLQGLFCGSQGKYPGIRQPRQRQDAPFVCHRPGADQKGPQGLFYPLQPSGTGAFKGQKGTGAGSAFEKAVPVRCPDNR